MAQEIREFAVLIPAGTAKAAPLTVDLSFPQRLVTGVSWRVPPGPSGLMGWALTSDGTPVIPVQLGTYMVTDNQAATWDLEGYLDSGRWQVTGYNTGLYDHTVYITFLLDLPGASPAAPPPSGGSGIGVIGTGGTVPPVTQPSPPPVSVPPTPGDDPEAVTTAVLAVLLQQILSGGG